MTQDNPISTFESVYAVPLHCDSCVTSVRNALKEIDGISKFDIDLKSQTLSVEGSVPPSRIVKAIQSTGKDAIIRGTGRPNSAAVCILESFDEKDRLNPVRGLARIVSLNDKQCLIDLTMNGVTKGIYYPSIRSNGNLSQGALSTGKSIYDISPIEVNEQSDLPDLASGQHFVIASMKIDDLIGRSVIVSQLKDKVAPDSLAGVIARSAGIWQNDKEVCSCTGKTVWQERKDAIDKGILF
ncbi:hypothetical protein PACTADRAFT_4572 [Pachysolen tannophilus NRRL Y-2460]|uniref:Superoxide dismutase 1 copper chaperone n=1 Tax=Pachysolen tannophilus NRRL Y-2460 TaxID=669874 RepID=A0A1E4TPM8_PACTA|nr:hypothetical protein PACTADRAFT_4572 [Pachysolen tannophilus NRRL Y-2460]